MTTRIRALLEAHLQQAQRHREIPIELLKQARQRFEPEIKDLDELIAELKQALEELK